MIHLLAVAAILAYATPAPTATLPPTISADGGVVQSPDPKSIANREMRAAADYGARVCHAAKLGGFVNARVMDYGDPNEPLPGPLGPWRIYCQRGVLDVAWKSAK